MQQDVDFVSKSIPYSCSLVCVFHQKYVNFYILFCSIVILLWTPYVSLSIRLEINRNLISVRKAECIREALCTVHMA